MVENKIGICSSADSSGSLFLTWWAPENHCMNSKRQLHSAERFKFFVHRLEPLLSIFAIWTMMDVIKFPMWEGSPIFRTMGKSGCSGFEGHFTEVHISKMAIPFWWWAENDVLVNGRKWNRQIKIPCFSQIANWDCQIIAWCGPVFGRRRFSSSRFGKLQRNLSFQRIINEEIIRHPSKYNFFIGNILIRRMHLLPKFTTHSNSQGHYSETCVLRPLNIWKFSVSMKRWS